MKKLAILTALLISGPAVAAGNADSADNKRDKMICRDMGETGSRLSKKRICMTSAEWAEHRRNTKMDIDKAQTQQVNKQGM